MHGLQPCGALVACGRRLFLQAISQLFLVVSSSTKKHTALGVPIRDYKKTKIILMGTPASEYRKESSNFFELSLCVEFIFAKENLFKLCIDYEK